MPQAERAAEQFKEGLEPQRCKKPGGSGIGLNRSQRLQQAILDPNVRTDGEG